MMDATPADSAPTQGSRFTALPTSQTGWVAIAVTAVYIALVVMMARVPIGLPTWLDFALGLVPGAIAAVVVGAALIAAKEHSWLIWVAAAGLLFTFGGWVVFAILAL